MCNVLRKCLRIDRFSRKVLINIGFDSLSLFSPLNDVDSITP